MRRKDRSLEQQAAWEIIDSASYAVFSCVNDEGEIFSLPLSLVRDGKSIFIHGAKSGSKEKLFGDGRAVEVVCVSYNKVPEVKPDVLADIKDDAHKLGSQVFTTEYKSAIAKTKAYQVTDDTKKIHALKILCEKYTPQYMSAFATAAYGSLNITNIYEFVIESVSAKAKIL